MIREINLEIQNKYWGDITDHCDKKVRKVMDFWWMLHGNLETISKQ